jgi:hypothetical protein
VGHGRGEREQRGRERSHKHQPPSQYQEDLNAWQDWYWRRSPRRRNSMIESPKLCL